MKDIEKLEQSLERMVPVALSRRASGELDETIDALALQSGEGRGNKGRMLVRLGGLAAAVMLGVFAVWDWFPGRADGVGGSVAAEPAAALALGVELIGQTDHFGEPSDGGLVIGEDGRMHRVLRYEMVGEELLRDARDGSVVRLVEPREEIVLVPVSSF